ncbi:Uncharacterised protein [Klebsiella pneumoniae]|uniref:Transmembrane protein n=1 Tax=Klebsiella pneumoniae TaxID=573 RepID=A0A377WHD1_KLEPN|nr:Uncharacterised protein [Klebsiella pneumoniae]
MCLKPILALIFILLLIITIITILARERNEEPKPLGTMNKCKIYALGDDYPDPELFSHARIMLSDIEIDCTKENRDIFLYGVTFCQWITKDFFYGSLYKKFRDEL